MDTLFWTKFNRNITIENTTKKYFNEYFCKLVLYAPSGRTILSSSNIEDLVRERKKWDKEINHFGYWGKTPNSADADVSFLELLRHIKQKSPSLKFRIEEPFLQIYARTEKELQTVVGSNEKLFKKYVKSISAPANDEDKKLLDSGVIIKSRDNGYKHKVHLRDMMIDPEIKRSVFNYLNNIEDLVHMPKSCKSMLDGENNYIWNCYFYSNDNNITTMLNLMAPGIVLNIHEMVVRTAK